MFGEWSSRHGDSANGKWNLCGEVTDGFQVFFIELVNEFVSVHIGCRFPTIMSFREPFPPDQVLDLTPILPNM